VNKSEIIDSMLKQSFVHRWAILNEQKINNIVNQFVVTNEVKIKIRPEELRKTKEEYIEYANLLNDNVIKKLNNVDFKNEKQLVIWLLHQIFKGIINKNRLYEDLDIIRETIQLYFNNIKEVRKTIDKNIYKIDYNELKRMINMYLVREDYEKVVDRPIAEGNGYKAYRIKNIDQCLIIGKGTSWCIKGEKMAQRYLKEGPLHLITKNGEKFALIQFASSDYMDINDIVLKHDVLIQLKESLPGLEKYAKPYSHIGLNFLWVNNPTDNQIKNALKGQYSIKYIKNPTEEMKEIAVKSDERDLKYIENPSEELQLMAVNEDAQLIKYIKNPTQKVINKVWNSDNQHRGREEAIKFFESPTEEMKLEAVKKTGEAIRHIKNPTEEMKLEALKQNGNAIRHIKNPTREMQLIAVRSKYKAIKYIENPTEEIKLEAIKSNPSTIEFIDNPTEEMQLIAVKGYNVAIKYIKNPTEKVQFEALKSKELNPKHIKNQTEKVKKHIKHLKHIGYNVW